MRFKMSETRSKKSFLCLNIAQSLGAFNDNTFKVLTSLLALSLVDMTKHTQIAERKNMKWRN